MVHSMTAFARVEKAGAQGTLSWELRSVNSRYLEPHLRLPESFRDLEGAVREALRAGISRGKLECTLRFTEETTGKPLQVDRERAAQLVAAAETIASLIKQPAALNPLEVLAWPGVLVADATDPQALNAEALALFNQGLKELKAGNTIHQPVYSFATHNRTDDTILTHPRKVMIVEGILILSNPELRDLFDIKIFVHADSDERLIRRLKRDIAERGRDMEEVLNRYQTTLKPMHQQFIESTKAFADIIIPNDKYNTVAIDVVRAVINQRIL